MNQNERSLLHFRVHLRQVKLTRVPPSSSEDLWAHQRISIWAHQRASELIREPPSSSKDLRAHQRTSKLIRGPPGSSQDLRAHQRTSELIRGPPISSEDLRPPPEGRQSRSETWSTARETGQGCLRPQKPEIGLIGWLIDWLFGWLID